MDGAERPAGEPGYERRDVEPRRAIVAALATAALIAGAGIASLVLVPYWRADVRRADEPAWLLAARRLPPPPRLELSRSGELEQLRAWEEQVLGAYGWVDREAGLVRVPIDRAMELLLRQEAGR